jgi:hypothetical protein
MNWNGIISLLVACIELILVVNIFAFAEKNKINKTAIVIVIVLLIYQSLEFLMCHFGFSYPTMAYFAFSDISLLPPLTLYFTLNFLDSPAKKYGQYIFIPALLFIIYYGLVVKEFKVVSCTVLYASYNYPLGTLYGAFYYIPLMAAMVMLITHIRKEKNGKKVFLSKVLLSGNIIVFIPVLTAFILAAAGYPMLLSSIESIMCKFALIIALCFTFMCLYDKKQKQLK